MLFTRCCRCCCWHRYSHLDEQWRSQQVRMRLHALRAARRSVYYHRARQIKHAASPSHDCLQINRQWATVLTSQHLGGDTKIHPKDHGTSRCCGVSDALASSSAISADSQEMARLRDSSEESTIAKVSQCRARRGSCTNKPYCPFPLLDSDTAVLCALPFHAQDRITVRTKWCVGRL